MLPTLMKYLSISDLFLIINAKTIDLLHEIGLN